jgi:glycerol-3-phosphate O-acyltransferase/dihydroxyacetone phosphate acyltransferase
MLARLVHWLGEALVRFYYPQRSIEHAERLPRAGPVIFVPNHPNGLLDPVLLSIAAGRPVRFLAKSTLFGNPLGRVAMRAFGAVPLYRAQDLGETSAEARAAANEKTFARCRELLFAGEALALFPEGVSHSDPQLKPLKPGAARIALSAERLHRERTGRPLGLHIVPVGLAYQAKTVFRTGALLVVGEPLAVEAGPGDERALAETLTERIRAALDEVVLQAESRDLLEGVARVAAWTADAPDREEDRDVEHNRRARELLDAYHTLNAEAPERVEPIVRAARDYGRVLRRLGVKDPWALELEPVRPAAALGALARLVLGAPAALVGVLLCWIPYRLAGQVAVRVTPDADVLGTVKLLAGALFLLLFWIAEATAAGVFLGLPWAIATLVAAPACGYLALRWHEMVADLAESFRHVWLRMVRPAQVVRLADRRRALCAAIARALHRGQDRSSRAPP